MTRKNLSQIMEEVEKKRAADLKEIEKRKADYRRNWKNRRAKLLKGNIAPDVMDEIERLGGNGLSSNDIRCFYAMSETEWVELWKDRSPINDIIETGRQKNVDAAATQLMDHVQEGNLKAIMFYLETVGKWRKMDKLIEDEKARIAFPAITLTVNDPL